MHRNRFEVTGYLAADPEVRMLPSGTRVANARLGDNYIFRTSDGAIQQRTNWFGLAFYDQLAAVASGYRKGEHLWIDGTIEQREFTPAGQKKRTINELVVRQCHVIASIAKAAAAEPAAIEAQGDPLVDDSEEADWPV